MTTRLHRSRADRCIDEPFDAVVIGGGPAGSVAAILLAQLGWRIALVERRLQGVSKTCGHCLSARAMPMLDSIGLGALFREVAVAETREMLAYSARPGRASSPPPVMFPAPALITPRDRLDHRLIGEARRHGVTVLQPAIAKILPRVEKDEHEIIVRSPCDESVEDKRCVRARFIIGADGLRSRVATAFGLHGPRRPGRKFGFSMRVRTATCPPSRAIEMFITPLGYIGMVRESPTSLHCAALMQPSSSGSPRKLHTFLTAMHETFPQFHDMIGGDLRHALASSHQATMRSDPPILAAGPMPYHPARVAARGVALVGDAAGYVEPFTGEGMTWAIESAIALAEVCESITPDNWRASEADRYALLHRQRIAKRQRLCRWISHVLEKPWMWRVAFGHGAFSTYIGRHAAERLHAA